MSAASESQGGLEELLQGLSIGPRWSRPNGSTVAALGTLDAGLLAVVDDGGLVSPLGSTWSLDWWVGADDRWYFPSQEPAVRQRRIGAGPVVETSMRIPSGDAVATVYGARSASAGGKAADAVVIEVSNRSPVPVALVIAVRPYPATKPIDPTGDDGDHSDLRLRDLSIKQIDSTTVLVDGSSLLLPRAAAGSVSSADGDVAEAILRGAELEGIQPVSGPAVTAAVMFPLPHATTLRFVLADHPIAFDQLPDAERVSRGWTSVVDGAARFSTPDEGVNQMIGAARARLIMASDELLDDVDHIVGPTDMGSLGGLLRKVRRHHEPEEPPCHSGAGDSLAALASGGHWDDVAKVMEYLAEQPILGCSSARAGSGLVTGAALAAALWMADDPERVYPLVERLLEPLTDLTSRAVGAAAKTERAQGNASEAHAGLALLCELAGQEEAAAHLRTRDQQWDPMKDPALSRWRSSDLNQLVAAGQAASDSRSWPEPDRDCRLPRTGLVADSAAGAAGYTNRARSLLVAEDLTGAVELLPNFPTAWRGGAVEVHQVPTFYGRLSFAIRWHGARPALLWELARSDSGLKRPKVTLRCSALDPDWRSVATSGETLLAGTQAGLGDAPAPGDSFG